MSAMLQKLSLARAALVVTLVAAATIAGAWVFQFAGYAPCELCLKQRIPYYVGVPVAFVAFLLASRNSRTPARVALALAGLIFVVGAGLGVYHSGVEFGFWPGPADCTGDLAAASSSQDFLKQLQTIQVVRCDAVAVRPLGLSLAVWNALISAALAVFALSAASRATPSRA